MDEGTHPNEPEESEADRYLGELRDEVSHLDSEGNQWTEDWTKKNELALREAGSVAGALSEPGFAIIKEVLEKLLAELDQLQEAQLHGKPIPWDYDPGQERADVRHRVELTVLATDWADRLAGLTFKLQHNLTIQAVRRTFIDSRGSVDRIRNHIERGLWLVAQDAQLGPHKSRRARTMLGGANGDPQRYAKTVARDAKDLGLETELLKTVVHDPSLDVLAAEGSQFPKIERIALGEGRTLGEQLIAGLEAAERQPPIKLSGSVKRELLEQFSEPYSGDAGAASTQFVFLSLRDLGFSGSARTAEIRAQAERLDIDPVADADGSPNVFRVRHGGGGRWLNGGWARPGDRWGPDNQFLFRLRPVPAERGTGLRKSQTLGNTEPG